MELLSWALWFYIISVISGAVGFSELLGADAAMVCKILFFIFLVLTLVALIAAGGNKRHGDRL